MDKQQGPTVYQENYIQYLISNQNGKNMKKYIYIHTQRTESLCRTAEINTTL